jgi:hypothetical protein
MQRSLSAQVVCALVVAVGAIVTTVQPARAQCTKMQCGLEVLRPTCAMLPPEGLDPEEKPRVAYNCTCCMMVGNQETCAPDDKIVPVLTVYSGNTKVTGTFKPSGVKCRLMPSLDLDRALGPGKYTIKAANNQGMVSFTVAGDPEGGCTVAPAGVGRARGLGLVGALGAVAIGLAVRRRRR